MGGKRTLHRSCKSGGESHGLIIVGAAKLERPERAVVAAGPMGLPEALPDHTVIVEADVRDERPTARLAAIAEERGDLTLIAAFRGPFLTEEVRLQGAKAKVIGHDPAVPASRVVVSGLSLKRCR